MYYVSHRHPRSCGFKPSIRQCRKQREKVDQHYLINQAKDSVIIIEIISGSVTKRYRNLRKA